MAYFKLVRDSTGKLLQNSDGKSIVYPDSWTVSFSGIDTSCAAICQTLAVFPGPNRSYKFDLGGSDPNDTFTLTRDDPTLEPCTWRYTTGTIGTFKTWVGDFCTPPGFPDTSTAVALTIRLRKIGANWILDMG